MALRQLQIQQLEALDPRIAKAFEIALKRAAEDCDDRPGEKRPRKVLLEAEFWPVADQRGDLCEVKGSFRIKSTIPSQRSKDYSFECRKGGMLVFNDLSQDDVNQKTFDEGDEE